MSTSVSRRSFLKWGVAAGACGAGLAACSKTPEPTPEPVVPSGGDDVVPVLVENGQWLTGACMNNCNCGSSRCLLKVYVEDGVPLKIRTDEEDPDTWEVAQRRACARGRARISDITSPARIKYPMKRKGWSPDNPNGQKRGVDEWERISWDEALDIVAAQIKKAMAVKGTHSILSVSYADIGDTYYDQIESLLNALGGAFHTDWGTVSMGSWPVTEMIMTGGLMSAPDYLGAGNADLHVHFGNNWTANKGGNTPHYMDYAKQQGGKYIIIDPWLNQTAQALADQWVPILPGGDNAFALAVAYHQITNGLYDQAYLDKYCSGFDAEHMPAGSDPKDNFKDYVLGTYDGVPKTPEWAEAICHTPAEMIKDVAEQIGRAKNVDFFAGQSTTKHPGGEMFAQTFFTLALMHGGIGKPGNYFSWSGYKEGMALLPLALAGDSSNGFGLNPGDPLKPGAIYAMVNFATITDWDAWDQMEYSEQWQSVTHGEYGRDSWPGGKKKVDIKMIYAGGYENMLNSAPNANEGIKAFRQVDFVWGVNPYFDPSRQYADVVMPVQTWWENHQYAWTNNGDAVFWADKIIEPIGESKTEGWIAEELAKRLGLDPKAVNTMTEAERTYMSLAGSMYLDNNTLQFAPLLTITQEDIDKMGVSHVGQPQQGKMTLAEFQKKGVYKGTRSKGDLFEQNVPFAAFIADPEANPLGTASGKFEIYCPTLAYLISSCGFTQCDPIGKWKVHDPEQGPTTQTAEYPLLLWTPHSLRRAHTVNDNVTSLREAFPQECFMSTVDAAERGIKNGDLVLMSSPYGKVLRPAKVMHNVIPGAVALQDGAWIQIDPATGIDLGGDPNILQAPKASGQGVQCWSGTLVQVEKYNGPLTLKPDKERPLVMPVGVE